MSQPKLNNRASILLFTLLWIGCDSHPDQSRNSEVTLPEISAESVLAKENKDSILEAITPIVVPSPPFPKGFVDLREFIPSLEVELRYYSSDNFIGDTVTGYVADRAILGLEAAQALFNVQADLAEQGLGLKLFDAYRPQQAVDHFIAWSRDLADTLAKADYYPGLAKNHLFRLGYIARQSSHSRGSAVDVTIIYQNPDSLKKEVDMGTAWDLFDEASHTVSTKVNPVQSANREMLRRIMVEHGYRSLPLEWWHFRLYPEPYPETYFDFEIR